jgi:adenylate cyclase
MRISIHSGDVAAGIIGTHKFAYEIWGKAVNVANRMPSDGAQSVPLRARACRNIP